MSSRRHKRRRVENDSERISLEPYFPSSPLARGIEVEAVASEEFPPHEAPSKEVDVETFAKEQDVWDAFLQENQEVLDQLPTSLHRDFDLIHELDQQAQEHLTNLSLAILKYVSLRRAMAHPKQTHPDIPCPDNVMGLISTLDSSEGPLEAHISDMNGKLSNGSSLSPPPPSTPGPGTSTRSRTTPAPPRSLAVVVQSSDSTRELLISIAQSVEEVSHASNEKYYLARHVYDLVDRSIRDLDRSIKEQEASISLGLRPGTHPASIILPEVVIPKPNRNRVADSPSPDDFDAEAPLYASAVDLPEERVQVPTTVAESPPSPDPAPEEEMIEIMDVSEAPELADPTRTHARRKGRKRRKSTRRPADLPVNQAGDALADPESGSEEDMEEEPRIVAQAPLRLRIPAQNVAPLAPDSEIPDPNEPRYCFCNQVSYGEMIACDNPTCAREWFHIGCVNLTRIPKGKWYCRDCADRKKSKGKKRAR